MYVQIQLKLDRCSCKKKWQGGMGGRREREGLTQNETTYVALFSGISSSWMPTNPSFSFQIVFFTALLSSAIFSYLIMKLKIVLHLRLLA